MVGRFVAGIGYAFMIAPVYTVEVSPASSRGFLTSFPEVFINVGILLGYVPILSVIMMCRPWLSICR
ncbi:Putative polyol transporter 1 [Linum perenne]